MSKKKHLFFSAQLQEDDSLSLTCGRNSESKEKLRKALVGYFAQYNPEEDVTGCSLELILDTLECVLKVTPKRIRN